MFGRGRPVVHNNSSIRGLSGVVVLCVLAAFFYDDRGYTAWDRDFVVSHNPRKTPSQNLKENKFSRYKHHFCYFLKNLFKSFIGHFLAFCSRLASQVGITGYHHRLASQFRITWQGSITG
jgi:hypothetical protein